ncbi:MAG: prephenate dehydrogenase/arogenate dehydrogenase family protein [Desulfovibrio sp.]|jgi:prephenate dehydrogenase|nr:prephenate dehydrogenase/arogenate dehydrogenase family protein [Desulfovibrio sp.]
MTGKVVLVGARGRMGSMLRARAAGKGIAVTAADIPLAPDSLGPICAHAALALLCVPAAVFEDTVRAVCPHLPPRAVLCDITSVKEIPLSQMEKHWPGPVVGTHPLFGPAPAADDDMPVAVVPGRGAKAGHLALVRKFFLAIGCRVFETTAQEHDQAMARIQGVNFITTLAYFALLAGREEILPFITPSFRRRLDAAQKMLSEDAGLFAGIFNANPHSLAAVRQYRQMLNLAAGGDIELLCERAKWWWKDRRSAQ